MPLLARTAGPSAHLFEESLRSIGFILSNHADQAITYDGKTAARGMKILKDIRVIELGTYITGPAAGMHLADLGADVIKVERPGTGDPFRAFKGGLYSPHYQTYNRNKRSIALDTALPDDRAVFHDLIAGADVFIQNFRPGVAEKLGAGEAELHRSTRASSTARSRASAPPAPPATARPTTRSRKPPAATSASCVSPTNPRVIGPAIADAVTGHYAAMGILAALLERETTGKGRRIDISMLEAMCHFNLDSFTHYYSVGEVMGPLCRPVVSQTYTFECADGKWVAIHMSSPPKFWEGLAEAIEQPESVPGPALRHARAAHRAPGDADRLLGAIFSTQPRRVVRPAAGRATCRMRRCTTPTRR